MIVTSHAIYAFRFKYFFSWFIVHFRSIDGVRLEDDASNEFFRIQVRNERGPLCEDRLRRHWTGPEASPLHASENITGRDNRRIHLHCGEILVPMFSSILLFFSYFSHRQRYFHAFESNHSAYEMKNSKSFDPIGWTSMLEGNDKTISSIN